MYYILFYETVDDYIELRKPLREAHLSLVKDAYDRGELKIAGALADPADSAVLVFKGDSPKVAEDFTTKDPYVLNGLIKNWKVRLWNVVIGGE